MNAELVKSVKDQIDKVLIGCEESGNYPTLCRLKSDPSGLERIYDAVINMITVENLGIDEALGQIESSWT